MVSLVLKPADNAYPSAAEVAAQVDAMLEDALAKGNTVDAIRMSYGYLSQLQSAQMTSKAGSFETYKGVKILVT